MVKSQIQVAQMMMIVSGCACPVVYLILMVGVTTSETAVATQFSFCADWVLEDPVSPWPREGDPTPANWGDPGLSVFRAPQQLWYCRVCWCFGMAALMRDLVLGMLFNSRRNSLSFASIERKCLFALAVTAYLG